MKMIFLIFSSSLAHLQPELELFEVLEFGSSGVDTIAMMMICRTFISQTSNSSSSGSRQAREEPKKKENHHLSRGNMHAIMHVCKHLFFEYELSILLKL